MSPVFFDDPLSFFDRRRSTDPREKRDEPLGSRRRYCANRTSLAPTTLSGAAGSVEACPRLPASRPPSAGSPRAAPCVARLVPPPGAPRRPRSVPRRRTSRTTRDASVGGTRHRLRSHGRAGGGASDQGLTLHRPRPHTGQGGGTPTGRSLPVREQRGPAPAPLLERRCFVLPGEQQQRGVSGASGGRGEGKK